MSDVFICCEISTYFVNLKVFNFNTALPTLKKDNSQFVSSKFPKSTSNSPYLWHTDNTVKSAFN